MTCHHCQNGLVSIFTERSVRAMRDGRYGERGTTYVITVACSCGAGDRYTSGRARVRRFHPWRDCVCHGSPADPENTERLREFVAARYSCEAAAVSSSNQFSEFNQREEPF